MATGDRSVPSVWARPPRKERSTLTREQIVTEALRLLDAEGIHALSMRKLAAGLGAGATSIYWHVANRDELIELLIDAVYGEVEVPDPDGVDDWRTAMHQVAHSLRAAALRHPWLVSVLDHLVAGYLGPNLTRASEQMLAIFEAAGFELREAEKALNTLTGYVTGIAMSEAAWHTSLARRGQSMQDWVEGMYRIAEVATQDYPRLRELVAGYASVDPQRVSQEDFDYGLERVLDGLQVRLDRLRRGTS